ncbi:receptor-type tyrosine-protein phosphatase epsilon-like isoform X2 [Ostrea edulis]|uniref:receptor-type tyrosine-protein phosphatase epsilon-like isoform X2 n=1 Tax=Ostrea edulis TaxID=37623 RepID=UPI0024AF2FD7|nr:receptor-type tyrosine-protein phosphatase epsilon-like isoform X2 [Ostrea edulis]
MLTFKLYYLWIIYFYVTFLNGLLGSSPSFVCKEAQQSSTNGSFNANLGCDEDINTFSLTNDRINQSWSVELENTDIIKYFFVIVGTAEYQMYVVHSDGIQSSKHMCIPEGSNRKSYQQLMTCEYPNVVTGKGNRIIIRQIGNGPLKLFEVKPFGFSRLSKTMILNHTDFLEPISKALDGDIVTYYNSNEDDQASWFLKLDKNYLMKWILVSIRGGNYDVYVKDGGQTTNPSTLCRNFSFTGPNYLKRNNKALECYREMTGDTIVIKRRDDTSMRIFEVYPIICPENHYGPDCAKCKAECISCSPITGVCYQWHGPFYGDFCQHTCPANCLNSMCDQGTGICENWKTEMVTHQSASGEDTTITQEMDVIQDVGSNSGDQTRSIILLSVLVVLAVFLVFTVVFFFKKGAKTQKVKTNEENVFSVEFHRVESRTESELEEIPQNEVGDVEDEIITVEYSNLTSQRVSVDQFIRELPEKRSNGILEKEFDELPTGLLESYSNALKASSRKGNRYKGIYPYDYNRVKLMRTYANENDDFVNASYIHGFNKERAYIAAQGPFNPKTLEDFWTMIWQNDVTRIVMLTNLYEGDRMKCLKYWPDTDLDIGQYTIRLDNVDVYDHYVLRYMVVHCQEEERKVTQFHFTTWPDNSIPDDPTSLIYLRSLVRDGLITSDGPIVVHCSAGIGRTGTFISFDYLLEEGAAEQTIDVKGYIASLRQQRGGSVQTTSTSFFMRHLWKDFQTAMFTMVVYLCCNIWVYEKNITNLHANSLLHFHIRRHKYDKSVSMSRNRNIRILKYTLFLVHCSFVHSMQIIVS